MIGRHYGRMDMRVVAREFLSSAQEALEQQNYSRAMIEANKVIDGTACFKVSRYMYRDQQRRRELEYLLRDAHLVNVEALLAIAQSQIHNGYTPLVKSTLSALLKNARGTTFPILKDIQTLQRRLEETASCHF